MKVDRSTPAERRAAPKPAGATPSGGRAPYPARGGLQ